MTKTFEGGCDCGTVRYQAEGPLRNVTNCHCSQCRRTHGHVAAYTEAEKSGFNLLDQKGLKWYASSESTRRGFCQEFGSSLFWDSRDSTEIGIAAGTLDGPTGLKTVGEIFVKDKSDYYHLVEGLPNREGG